MMVESVKELRPSEKPQGYVPKTYRVHSNRHSERETLELLTDTHFPSRREHSISGFIVNCPLFAFLRAIKWALDIFKPFKSPGTDGIYPDLLQHQESKYVGLLKRIFETSTRLQLQSTQPILLALLLW